MKKYIYILILIIIAVVASLFIIKNMNEENPIAIINTSEGVIELELFLNKTPTTSENFIKLSKEGFYDNTKFHRVIKGFMIQGGDPLTKEDNESLYGTGGPNYTIEDEFVDGLSNTVGTISMANTGMPNTGGSQFFINTADNIFLDGKHAVFGKVINGMEIVKKIEETETNERDLPVNPITILSIEI